MTKRQNSLQADDVDVEVCLLGQILFVGQSLDEPVPDGGRDLLELARVPVLQLGLPGLGDDPELAVDLVLVVLALQRGVLARLLLGLDLSYKDELSCR